jgi:WD40 repeat protein
MARSARVGLAAVVLVFAIALTASSWPSAGHPSSPALPSTAAFSADGGRVVTISGDDTARIWDAAGGRLLRTLRCTRYVTSVVFSPDGSRVVTVSEDGIARIWDAASGRILHALRGVRSAVLSPDGRRIVTASRGDDTARIWEVGSGRLLRTLRGHTQLVTSVVFSSDGSRVVTASDDGTARIWDAASGRILHTLGHPGLGQATPGMVESAVFSPDGRRVVTADFDGSARIWDAASGRLLHTLLVLDTDPAWSAVFSPDGSQVVTASGDSRARIWDATSGRLLHVLHASRDEAVRSAVFSPDGQRIVTATEYGTGRIWDAGSGSLLHTLPPYTASSSGAVFTPDGSEFVTVSGGIGRIWDTASARLLRILPAHVKEALPPAPSLDTLSTDGIVSMPGPVVSLAADGGRVAAAVANSRGWCSHIVVWDVASHKIVSFWPAFCAKTKKLPEDDGVQYGNIDEVALAGDRAAWIRSYHSGSHEWQCVETATSGAPSVRIVVGPCNVDDAHFWQSGGEGLWATNIVGADHLLALNTWSTCTSDMVTCHVPKGWFAAETGALRHVAPTGLHRVASGLETLYAVSADAGRILVLRSKPPYGGWSDGADGTLAIYRSDGRLLQTLDVSTTVGAVRDARLQGNHVAVLTSTQVAILDAATGKPLRAWPLPSPASKVTLQDLHEGTAVYVSGPKINLVRLSDGKRAVIAVPGQGVVRAQLEAPGLFYTYFSEGSGHIALIPTAQLSARFGT